MSEAAATAAIAAPSPELSVIVLSWNTRELLRKCLQSVVGREQGLALEVIVVDNASRDGSAEMVAQEFPQVRLVRNGVNEGYARGNNQGMRAAKAPLLLLLNSDTEVRPGALKTLVSFLRGCPEYGAVSPRLVHPDGRVQRSCMRFPDLAVGFLYDSWFERKFGRSRAVRRYFMEDFDHEHDADVEQPPGACMLLTRAVFEKTGGFDERLFLFFNDVELCRAIHDHGWKIRYLARAEVLHHVGKSTSQFKNFVTEWNVNRARYYRRRHGRIGAWVVKSATLLRACEEAVKVWRVAPPAERRAGLGDIARVLRATWSA